MQNDSLQRIYSDLKQNRSIPVGFASQISEECGINENTVTAALTGNIRVYVSDEAKSMVISAAVQILSEKIAEIKQAAEHLKKLQVTPQGV